MIVFACNIERGEILFFSFLPSFLQLSSKDENWDLASVLAILIVSSLLGVVTPNFIYRDSRTHNGLKLVNDCLGRAQLAFVSFYLTLLVVVDLRTAAQKRLIGFFLLLSFLFLVIGIRQARGQTERIRWIHGGKCKPGPEHCELPLGWRGRWKIYGTNALLGIASAAFAIYIAFSPTVVAKKPSNNSVDQPQSAVAPDQKNVPVPVEQHKNPEGVRPSSP